jgi:hypothetical protein
MAWTGSRASSGGSQSCIGDLAALSTPPAAWQNYDIRQIGSSILAAPILILDAGFVSITVPLGPADLRPARTAGMGLGRSICRWIIEVHNGQLIAAPNPGAGAIFRFSLASGGVPDGD